MTSLRKNSAPSLVLKSAATFPAHPTTTVYTNVTPCELCYSHSSTLCNTVNTTSSSYVTGKLTPTDQSMRSHVLLRDVHTWKTILQATEVVLSVCLTSMDGCLPATPMATKRRDASKTCSVVYSLGQNGQKLGTCIFGRCFVDVIWLFTVQRCLLTVLSIIEHAVGFLEVYAQLPTESSKVWDLLSTVGILTPCRMVSSRRHRSFGRPLFSSRYGVTFQNMIFTKPLWEPQLSYLLQR